MRIVAAFLEDFFEKNLNGPTSEMAFVKSPGPTMCVIVLYLLIVKVKEDAIIPFVSEIIEKNVGSPKNYRK